MRNALVVALALSRAAFADPTQQDLAQAKTYYEVGREAFDNAKYDLAIRALEQAYSIVPDRASVKFSLAKAYRYQYFLDRDVPKAKRASELFRDYAAKVAEGDERQEAVRYLAELAPVVEKFDAEHVGATTTAPVVQQRTELMVASRTPKAKVTIDGGEAIAIPALAEVTAGKHTLHVEADGFFADDSEVEAVDGRLVPLEIQLREKPGTLAITAPQGTTIEIDGKPTLSPAEVPAGKHFVAVTQRGHEPFTREVSLARGEKVTISTGELQQTKQRRVAYYLAGGAGVLALGGVVSTGFALLARSDADDIAASRANGHRTPAQLAEHNQHVDDFSRDKTLSYVLYGSAAALIATSAFLYFSDNPRVEARQPMVTASPVPGGMTLGVVGRF
jgi:hypothetical protein